MFDFSLQYDPAKDSYNPTDWSYLDDFEFDDSLESVQMVAGTILGWHTGILFSLSGFGLGEWPTTVDPEMLILVEHLQDLLEWIDCDSWAPFTIYFYEQGLQLLLLFERDDTDLVLIKCYSEGNAQHYPQTETLSRGDLNTLATAFVRQYVMLVKVHAPDQFAAESFKNWLKGPTLKSRLVGIV
jgi:hypothetical protein